MSSNSLTLPSYKQPPVDEVVCGFRFEPLPELKVPHVGLLWEKFRDRYPTTQHAAPIGTDGSLPMDQITGFPIPRVWFISKADNELIQFQLDRFYYNWRRRGDEYPHYSSIIVKFEEAKHQLDEFVKELQLGTVKATECELTYINHIPKGQGWENIDDLAKIIQDFTWQKDKHNFLPSPANIAWQARFSLPDGQGWLSAKLNEARRKVDNSGKVDTTSLLLLELTARSLGEMTTAEAQRKWFDLAHEWIVRGFADLTTKEIQDAIWKRET